MKRYVISRPEQLRAIRSPVRQRILEVMERGAACSVADLALRIGIAKESLYYHVHALTNAGLLIAAGEQSSSRRQERLYRLVAPEVVVDSDECSPEFLEALADLGSTALRAADREFRAALECASASPRRRVELAQLRRWEVRLEPAAVEELQRLLVRLESFLLENDGGDGERYELTAVLVQKERRSPRRD